MIPSQKGLNDRFEGVQNLFDNGRYQRCSSKGVRTAAYDWANGHLSLHLHYALTHIGLTDEDDLVDWCARIERDGPLGEVFNTDDSDSGVDAVGVGDAVGCEDRDGHRSMLVNVRETSNPADASRPVAATVRLVPLHDCPVWRVRQPRRPSRLLRFEIPGTVVHRELHSPCLLDRERRLESLDESPRQVVESGTVVADGVAQDDGEVLAQMGHRRAEGHQSRTTGKKATTIDKDMPLPFGLDIDGERLSCFILDSSDVAFQHFAMMFAPVELPPSAGEGAGSYA